jgi:ABC-2 type transport system ATP-binding protein
MQHAVTMERLTKRFGDDIAVDGITLAVAPGTIVGIIGPSGAGKTTLVRLMTGALTPSDGEVRVMGEDPLQFRRETRERIGYMPQSFALYPDLTTRENVDFVASLFGLLWWRRRRRTREVLEWVDLWDVRGRRAGRLSGGMQRRLELASALVHDPTIAFLDEPTAGIDPLLRATIWAGLDRLRDQGRTLLVTTQYVNEAEQCDAVLLISEGRVIATGTPAQLRRIAIGGDEVVIDTREPLDASVLRDMPDVRRLEQRGPTQVRVTVADSSATLPDIVEAITAKGGEVVSAAETRPSFDEVFALLVERNRAERASDDDAGKAA